MYGGLKDELLRAADGFRGWAHDNFPRARSAEWEAHYPEWIATYDVCTRLIQGSFHECWDDEMKQALLHLIARDNESEILMDVVAEDTDLLLTLAGDSLLSTEKDARWQFAERLGRLHERKTEAEALLLQFVRDDDEYVSRQALLGLGRFGSDRVEEHAEKAWGTGHEYQRMAVLYALYKVGSPDLPEYLTRAEADGRRFLIAHAARIRSGDIDR
jgi:HEAT repeat protein